MYNSPILASEAVNTGVHQIALDSLDTDPQGDYFLTLHSCGTMSGPTGFTRIPMTFKTTQGLFSLAQEAALSARVTTVSRAAQDP